MITQMMFRASNNRTERPELETQQEPSFMIGQKVHMLWEQVRTMHMSKRWMGQRAGENEAETRYFPGIYKRAGWGR